MFLRSPKLSLLALALFLMLYAATPNSAQSPRTPEADVVRAWNAIVVQVLSEDDKLLELYNSLNKYRPGRVILPADVRAEQKRKRLTLINEIITSNRARIRELENLARAEEASQ